MSRTSNTRNLFASETSRSYIRFAAIVNSGNQHTSPGGEKDAGAVCEAAPFLAVAMMISGQDTLHA
jgi:hypothetical protein